MKTSTHNHGHQPAGLNFSPEVEREWQELRETIQDEYRQERRQVFLRVGAVLAGTVCALWVVTAGVGVLF
jgi:NAD dependent epimerase/dehydratase family enzyme